MVEGRLCSILKPHDSWWDDGEGNAGVAAREALLEFCKELKRLRPAREYVPGNVCHTSYIRGLLAVKMALVEGRYRRACNEIITLLATQPLLQGRVYYNLLRILERELAGGREGGGGDRAVVSGLPRVGTGGQG